MTKRKDWEKRFEKWWTHGNYPDDNGSVGEVDRDELKDFIRSLLKDQREGVKKLEVWSAEMATYDKTAPKLFLSRDDVLNYLKQND